MEFTGTWKEIWTQKGQVSGTIEDVYIYGGWEKSNNGAAEANAQIERVFNRIVEETGIKKDDKVLELGCGAGAYAQHFETYLEDGIYAGIDFSRPLVEKCNQFFGSGKVCALNAEANNIPFKDKYFDVVFCYGLFFYFPTKEYAWEVMQEMIRVSKRVVFIGEIAHSSQHESKHLLIQREDFDGWKGWQLSDSWYPAYEKERYNATFMM